MNVLEYSQTKVPLANSINNNSSSSRRACSVDCVVAHRFAVASVIRSFCCREENSTVRYVEYWCRFVRWWATFEWLETASRLTRNARYWLPNRNESHHSVVFRIWETPISWWFGAFSVNRIWFWSVNHYCETHYSKRQPLLLNSRCLCHRFCLLKRSFHWQFVQVVKQGIYLFDYKYSYKYSFCMM